MTETVEDVRADMSLTIDTLCKHRGKLLRTIDETLRFQLVDALYALRHGSPEVTEEFLDRAILSLTAARTSVLVEIADESAAYVAAHPERFPSWMASVTTDR